MQISVIGAGNVARQFCEKISSSDCHLHQIYNRTHDKSEALADQYAASVCYDIGELNTNIDLLMVIVSDDAISKVAGQLRNSNVNVPVVHTSGSKAHTELLGVSESIGVFYPLQTFKNFELQDWSKVPILIHASNPGLQSTLIKFAQTLDLNYDFKTDSERKALHVSAVIINNFINHLLCLNQEWITDHKSDLNLLIPLLEKTIENARESNPCSIQTGPAIRNDQDVINEHISMLTNYPLLKDLYTVFSESIIKSQS